MPLGALVRTFRAYGRPAGACNYRGSCELHGACAVTGSAPRGVGGRLYVVEKHFDLDAGLKSRAVDLGAQAAKKLGEVGIRTYRELLDFLPRRYEDRRALPDYAALVDG